MIKNFLDSDEDKTDVEAKGQSRPKTLSLFDSGERTESADEPYVLSSAPPESFAETTRRSGLAWSAGIAFFASVVFMLIIGWGADLLFGSSPWGMVGGIVLGSVIGFIQFFRLTSQIFK
jgi:F0F1-type ATP synthase assembly protein I